MCPRWILLTLAVSFGCVHAQTTVSDAPDTPFKLATYDAGRGERVGLTLGDRILDLGDANDYIAREAGLGAMPVPTEMKQLIEEYDRVRSRLYQIANFLDGKTDGLAFAHDVADVSLKAPIKYPWNLLAAAANYRSHAAEMNTEANVDPDKDFPFLFAKSARSGIIDPGEPYFIPPGRDKIDWEGELGIVIGNAASRVPLENAIDHVFGFTIVYDVSDRGGQHRGNPMFQGPDWFSGKSRDRAAPMGPFITPREFLPNHANLRLVTKVNDRVVQDGNTKDLIYDTEHLVHHISQILTLYPGDVIASGTPDGVGAGRKPPEFLKPGDVVSIEIEGIGTLTTPMEAPSPTS
ncbi:MAG TPA: fumarylacetoacetate hydrolase family protein [Vicinamibacteria bacterium]|nr:fumarylacetoacetate hydrolase family protein [Vicinamibacteria bacterium]